MPGPILSPAPEAGLFHWRSLMGILTGVLRALGLGGDEEPVKSSNGALHTSVQDMIGISELLGALLTVPADIGFPFVGVTSTSDINLGAAGAVGDYLGDISIHNASGSNITQISIKDGSTEMVGLRYTTAIATATGITIPGPRTRSVNGGWKIAITCAGTMASINGYARGRLS